MTQMRTTNPGADPIRACSRKKAYPTEQIAKSVARKVSDRSGEPIVPYGCTMCGSWHIGHRGRQG